MTRSPFAFAAALCAILAPQTASALSCRRPDVTRSFNAASEADERYIVVYGEFTFNEARNPSSDMGQPVATPTPFVARFNGHYLSVEGFVNVVDIPINVQPQCASVWCGRLASDTPSVAFVEMQGDDFLVNVGPCPQWVFTQPSEQDLAQLTTCINGGPCEQLPRR